MFRLFLSLFIFLLLAESANSAPVDVTVTNIDSEGGDVRVVMYANQADWLTHHGTNVLAAAATPGEMKFTYPNVKPGAYAILVYHDVNRNQDLDENFLGIPTEQFGFTNDPGYSHKPKMSEAQFTVGDQPVALAVKLSDE